ncbi:MAG: hypothetical protein H0X28_06915 [Solirubrobacterales bacterium]|nr:hypothetical protein [Solirubrobacterales bacterium]
MDQMKTARNVAIILAIAAAVNFLPGGGRAAHTFEAALWVAFAGGAAYMALRLYREHRIALHSLGHHHRALLYGAVAAGAFAWMARKHMWYEIKFASGSLEQVHRWGGLGEVVWFGLVGGVLWALLEVFRHARSY